MKKIISLVLVLVLALTAIGGTLAYFTDTDVQLNTFVTGNVAIDLFEDFGANTGTEKLMPAVYKTVDGKTVRENAVEKEVYVENEGTEDAYVRVHIAIPAILDNGSTEFDAGKNVLHFNADEETLTTGKWNWGTKIVEGREAGKFFGTGDTWNYYTVEIDKISYNVYVVTYETALKKGEATVDAMSQVYLDATVTNEDITRLNETLGTEWHIYAAAEGTQVEGFVDAFDALNTSFGVPGTYTFDWDMVAQLDSFKDVA